MSSIALEKESNLNLADEIDNIKLSDLSQTEPKAIEKTKQNLFKSYNLTPHLENTSTDTTSSSQQQTATITYMAEQYKQIVTPPNVLSPSTQTLNINQEQVKLELQKQLEYYFSSKNLQNDGYLRSQMDSEDYVPISLIAQFNRIKQYTNDIDLIVSVIKQSSQLKIDPTYTKVRSINGIDGGLITINSNFSKKLNKSYMMNTIDSKNIAFQQQRCVLILREVASEANLEQIKELFINKEPRCPPCIDCEAAGNQSWYITFSNEEEAQKALQYLKGEVQMFMDKPIRARIKTHTTIPRSTSSLLTNNNKVNTVSPSSPPQTPTSLNRTQTPPANYNQNGISYDTPPSSYMSNTSSPSPAAIYSTPQVPPPTSSNQDVNQNITYHHDAGLHLIVQKTDFDNQSGAFLPNAHPPPQVQPPQQVNQLQQPSLNNYIAYNPNQTNLKYFPNSKLIINQQYLFHPNTSSTSSRQIVFPAHQTQPTNWHMNQIANYSKQANFKYNNTSQPLDEHLASPTTNNKQTDSKSIDLNDENKTNDKNYASPNSNETNNESSNIAVIYPNQPSILQIQNYYQSHPHQQGQQMVQLPLNSTNYNRSSPAAVSAFYQNLSQSPSQQYLPLISGPNQGQSTVPTASLPPPHAIQASLLSSASNSSISSNNQSSTHQIPYTNLPGVYPQSQFIIQNSQFLNHASNQPTQISIINSNNHMMYPVVTSNNSNNNSNPINKSSTPTPNGATSNISSSSSTTSVVASHQITSPPIYNTNQYFVATNLPINNASNNATGVNPVSLNTVYQLYQTNYNNNINPVAQQQFNQSYNHTNVQAPPLPQQSSHSYQTNPQQSIYQVNYELIQPQFDTQNAATFQVNAPLVLQSQSQPNLTISSSDTTKSQSTQSNSDNTSNSVTQQLGVISQSSLIQHSLGSHQTPPSQSNVIFYNNHQNPSQMIINSINQSTVAVNSSTAQQPLPSSTSQLLMTTLTNSSSTSTNQNNQNASPHHLTALPLNLNGQTAIISHSVSNATQRRVPINSTSTTSNNASFNNNNNHHVHNTNGSHHSTNNHRNYNTNSRNKYFNQQYNNNSDSNSNHHHNPIQSTNQKNSISANIVESTPTQTSNEKLIEETPSKQHQIDNDKTKSPPNNSDLASFPPLLNSSTIPVNKSTTTSNNVSSTNPTSEQSELASVQLDPAIICINSTIPPTFTNTTTVNTSNNNKYTKSTNLNKILIPLHQPSNDQQSDWDYSIHSNKQHSVNDINNALTNIKHHVNLKHYDMIKSHLGFNNYQSKQTNSQQNTNQNVQAYTNNTSNSNNYKSGAAANYNSRKSIESIHSQSNSQRMHSQHGINSSVSNKFYNNNNNNERSSSSSSINKNNRHNFSTNQQLNLENNKNSTIASIKNDNNQHVSSPSFNRKQKSNNQSYHNRNNNNSNNLHNTKPQNENTKSSINNQINNVMTTNEQSNFQNSSLISSSSSSSQTNDEDANSLNSNSWNNKKLTFAEIVQQKSANSSINVNDKNGQNNQLLLNQQDCSNGCSPNASSSASATSATSSQATTPTLQAQANSPFSLRLTSTNNVANSFTDSDQSTNDQSEKLAGLTCYTLNKESTNLTNSSIQV